jgi:hypothetical protein
MIKTALEKLGYVKANDVRDLEKNPFTEQELLNMLTKYIPLEFSGDKDFSKTENLLFSKISQVDGIMDYYNETLARDMRRFFAATTEHERWMSRGAYARTVYFKSLTKGKSEAENKPEKTKIVSRYA